jgi:arylsulfatase A-like enzyme
VVTDLARSLDIAPTILDVIKLDVPEAMMGRSLWSETDPPSFVFSEEDHEGNVVRSVRTFTDKLILANPDNPRGLPRTALYDLSRDPGEQNDLTAQYPGTISRMTKWVSQAEVLTQGQAVEAEAVEIDPEVEERLRSLGYIE